MMKAKEVINRIKNLESQKNRINGQIWELKMINDPEPVFLRNLLKFINQHKNDSNSTSFDNLCGLIKNRLSIKKPRADHSKNENDDQIKSKFKSNNQAISRLSKILAKTQKQN